MGQLNEVLQRIAAGETTAEQAAPEVRRICRAAGTRASTTDETFARMAGALDDRDAADTFLQVSAAWMAGRLTDEQHAVLRAAVLADGATDGETDGGMGQEQE